ncbi:hypothetical protein T440DRAFT_507412 [Plenodomus tracheiphilus IPT5]|uniref:Uncharacterized protein n=1 Tax=Plenodomus tracheiphilus IPT5 TaxID=1408161 RepID=A0A6A7BAX2_9PLEO|nr:hypothetical protein T440DRAFT_507412 [Plenodomus tracheiphilus IPT5]
MVSRDHKRQSHPILDAQNALSQRPQTILQRISSGISTIRLAIIPRRVSNKNLPPTRPQTAPAIINRSRTNRLVTQVHAPAPRSPRAPPPPTIPLLSEPNPEEPCPYDSNLYHSFPSIRPECTVCGLRHLSSMRTTSLTWTSGRPCSGCRSGSANSHLGGRRRGEETGVRQRRSSRLGRQNKLSHNVGTAVTMGDKEACIHAEGRCSDNIQGVSLSQARVRTNTGVADALYPPTEGEHHFSKYAAVSASSFLKTLHSSTARGVEHAKPESPALHHLPVLSKSQDYPYVHKREVGPHINALRAGSPSPLRQTCDEREHTYRLDHSRSRTSIYTHAHDEGIELDYSETVYLGHGRARRGTESTESTERVGPASGRRMRSSVLIIESFNNDADIWDVGNGHRRGRIMEEEGESDTQSARCCAQSSESEAVERAETQDSQTIGPELKGGCRDGVLRLRGGASEQEHKSCGFSLCRWVLLGSCFGSNTSQMARVDALLPPPRTISSSRLANRHRASREMIRLPVGLTRDSYDIRPIDARSREISPIQPNIARNIHVLRGGAGSPTPSTFSVEDKLPPTLFWLAGGKGRPTSVAGWKKSRPEKRMGGLLGMAMFGRRAGVGYRGIDDSGGSNGDCETASIGGSATNKRGSDASVRSNKSRSSGIQRLHVTEGDSSSTATERDVEATHEDVEEHVALEDELSRHVDSGVEGVSSVEHQDRV